MSNSLAAELDEHEIAVTAFAPWDNVATEGAGQHDLVDGVGLEAPEWIAEAALILCSTPAAQITGDVLDSQPFSTDSSGVRQRADAASGQTVRQAGGSVAVASTHHAHSSRCAGSVMLTRARW